MRRRSIVSVMVVGLACLTSAAPHVLASSAATGDSGLVAFVGVDAGHCSSLYLLDPISHGRAKLDRCGHDEDPAWSPTGRQLAYVAFPNQVPHIYVRDASGHVMQLTSGSDRDAAPAWSPDGQTIAFARQQGGTVSQIYSVPAAGGSPTQLTTGQDALDPVWSPDGTRIYFVRNNDIWVMASDGSGPVAVAQTSSVESRPAVAPDGSKIAFVSDADGDPEIYTMNSDGSAVTQLTNDSVVESKPSFSPDGVSIVYTQGCCLPGPDFSGGDLWVVGSSGGSPQQLTATSLSELTPAWSTSCSGCWDAAFASSNPSPRPARHARKVSIRIAKRKLVGKVSVPDGTAPCRANVKVAVERVQSLEFNPSPNDWHRGLVKIVSTSSRGTFHVAISLGGEYRAVATSKKLANGDTCKKATSPVKENDLIHDPRGDSRGPIDIKWASMTYSHHEVISKIVAYKPFSGTLNPCFLAGTGDTGSAGGSVGCFGPKICCTTGANGPHVTIRRPDARTIVFVTTVKAWKQMGLTKRGHWLYWLAWDRQSDEVLWDDAPSGCFNSRPCGSKEPVLTIPKSAF